MRCRVAVGQAVNAERLQGSVCDAVIGHTGWQRMEGDGGGCRVQHRGGVEAQERLPAVEGPAVGGPAVGGHAAGGGSCPSYGRVQIVSQGYAIFWNAFSHILEQSVFPQA